MNKILNGLLVVFGFLSTATIFPLSQKERENYRYVVRAHQHGKNFSEIPQIKNNLPRLIETAKEFKEDAEFEGKERSNYLKNKGLKGLVGAVAFVVYNMILTKYQNNPWIKNNRAVLEVAGIFTLIPICHCSFIYNDYNKYQEFLQRDKAILDKLENLSLNQS